MNKQRSFAFPLVAITLFLTLAATSTLVYLLLQQESVPSQDPEISEEPNIAQEASDVSQKRRIAIEPKGEDCIPIHEGNSDHSRAVDMVVIGADDSFSGDGHKYSDKPKQFKEDAILFSQEFLSTPPFSGFKNNFNIYYSSQIIDCTAAPFGFESPGGTAACPGWQDVANACSTPYDMALIIVNAGLEVIQTFDNVQEPFSGAGQTSTDNSAFVQQSSPALIHEIGHLYGLLDEYIAGNIKAPNVSIGPEASNRPLCRIRPDPARPSNAYNEETMPTDTAGGTCSFQLRYTSGGYSPLYVTNERSLMKAGLEWQRKKFSLLGEIYLKEVMSRIAQVGYKAWLPEQATWDVFEHDEIPTVTVPKQLSAKVGQATSVPIIGSDNASVRSLHILNFGDATFADHACTTESTTCSHAFTHTYTSPGIYYGRAQVKDSLGQGSSHIDFVVTVTN